MTSITIPEAILSHIKPGEQAVGVRDATGRTIGYFATVATPADDRQARPAVADDDMHRLLETGRGG